MKMVDGEFVCTKKEMKDIALIDQMFRKTCFGLRCDECPFRNIRMECIAVLFMHRVEERAKLKRRSGI